MWDLHENERTQLDGIESHLREIVHITFVINEFFDSFTACAAILSVSRCNERTGKRIGLHGAPT